MTAEPENQPQPQEPQGAEQATAETSEQETALAEAEAKIAELSNEMLRVRAEADNVRKRAARDAEHARKFALERFMGDLLDVKDSLERGLEAAAGEDASVTQLREGTELTLKMLSKVLDKYALVELDPTGEAFDPELHEALSMLPSPDHQPNTVVSVIQKGYRLNERLLRPARVIVAQEPK